MSGLTAFRLTQAFYWLFLGLWIGGMVMLAVGAAITFKTLPEYRPTIGLETYNHPDLRERAPAILAGAVTGNILKALAVIQLVCAGVVVACTVVQCVWFADYLRGGAPGGANLLRIALIALPILILGVDALVIGPRVWGFRHDMYDAQRTAAQRDDAKVHFDQYHRLNTRLFGFATLCLIGAVFASSFTFTPGGPDRPRSPEARREAPRG
jgi:hypothetical protein